MQQRLSRAETARVMREVGELMTVTGLDDKADRLVGELAHGDQRAAEIAMGAGAAATTAVARRTDRWDGGAGNLSYRQIDPSAAQGQQLHDRLDRA